MVKHRTRVAQQAQEARQRSAQVEQKIKELSTQISNPQKYFAPKSQERAPTAVDLFRRYFVAQRAVIQKRKPTRRELRVQRSWAIIWVMLAFVALMCVLGQIWHAWK